MGKASASGWSGEDCGGKVRKPRRLFSRVAVLVSLRNLVLRASHRQLEGAPIQILPFQSRRNRTVCSGRGRGFSGWRNSAVPASRARGDISRQRPLRRFRSTQIGAFHEFWSHKKLFGGSSVGLVSRSGSKRRPHFAGLSPRSPNAFKPRPSGNGDHPTV